jgi:hypothetical protein
MGQRLQETLAAHVGAPPGETLENQRDLCLLVVM